MQKEVHYLNSICTPNCPIGFIHIETQEILKLYPFLDIKSPYSFELSADSLESYSNSIERESYDYNLAKHKGWVVTEIDQLGREYGFNISLLERDTIINSNLNKVLPFFFEHQDKDITKEDLFRISSWNRMILGQLIFNPSSTLPIMPIQVLWLMAYPIQDKPSAFAFMPHRKKSLEHLLISPAIPPQLLLLYCYHKNGDVSLIASENPNCPKEGRIFLALNRKNN